MTGLRFSPSLSLIRIRLYIIVALLVAVLTVQSANAEEVIGQHPAFPHPSCLDFDLGTGLLNDYLVAPIDLNCNQAKSNADVYDYFGFTTYERPRDPAGERRGALGYQRFEADDGAALYLFRTEVGGNAVFSSILTGREVKQGDTYLLEQGQLHSTGEDCQGVKDVWTEPNNTLHVSIELSVYEALQAFLLPDAGPPSSSQRSKLLDAILREQDKEHYADYQRSCSVTAEYLLDSASMELQLTSLRFDIENSISELAFNWFKSLLPASENLDVGVLIEDDLRALRNKLLPGFITQYQLVPPSPPNQTISLFIDRLYAAVQQKDIDTLLKMTSEDVMLGFGGSGGHQDLQNWLTQESADDDWENLETMLAIPGILMSPEVFCIPFPGCKANESTDFSIDTLIAIKADIPLYALPKDDALVIRNLDFERVEWQYPFDENARFKLVETFAGERGYVDKTLLRSPLDMRMEIALTEKGWLIQSILSGD